MKNGYFEAQDENGIWHKVDGFQAASLRLAGINIRFIEQ